MNKLIYSLLIGSIYVIGCTKEKNYNSGATSTLMVINGVSANPSFSLLVSMNGKLNSSGTTAGSSVTNVAFGNGTFYYFPKIRSTVALLKSTDSSSLVSDSYDLSDNGMYSLLVTGIPPTTEAVFIKEQNYPFIKQDIIPSASDSVINVRFINLTLNTSPLSIRIAGSATNEVTNLVYKGYTDFKAYPAKASNSSYKFEILNGATVETTFTLNVSGGNRFKNVAILIRGIKGGTPALGISTVNYY